MGYLGLGSTLSMMGLVYGDEESLKFTEEVSRILAEIGWQVGIDLAKEKGPAPIMDEEFEVTASTVSYTHLRAHETLMNLVCRLLLEKKS